jgi:pimeloyl-ACP methyl ester carboxylesterase
VATRPPPRRNRTGLQPACKHGRVTGVARAIGIAVAAVALLGAAAPTTTTTVAPTGDAFYLPPVPLPLGEPGDLIRAVPIAAPPGARAWRVLSHTQSLSGSEAALSTIVIAPDGPAPKKGRVIVSWAHGTTGLADQCAPSKDPNAAVNLPWIADLLAAGYVVAATDYQGLGTPGVHPYLVGESEGRAVLDAARAARHLPAGAGRRVLIAGHSQGGHAALYAGEIAHDYAPELRVLGVASGAPVSDPGRFLDLTAASPATAGFVLMGVSGYLFAYPELARMPMVLSSDAALRADRALSECAGAVVGIFANDDVRALFARDLRTVPEWTRRLDENAAGHRPAGAPVFVWQGSADPLTPADVNADYVQVACAQGSTVAYRVYDGADHGTVFGAAHDDVLAFFAARVKGTKPHTDCG